MGGSAAVGEELGAVDGCTGRHCIQLDASSPIVPHAALLNDDLGQEPRIPPERSLDPTNGLRPTQCKRAVWRERLITDARAGHLTNFGRLDGSRTGRHDDGVDAELLVGEHALEGLALALATPDTQDQGNLDLRQLHVVLGNMDGHLQARRGSTFCPGMPIVCCTETQGRPDPGVATQGKHARREYPQKTVEIEARLYI